ncbi:MAG: hypothetical protein QGG40_06130 [Myxococcota bacterium]|nr:hypothetical protein [Myxococcota bacterium]
MMVLLLLGSAFADEVGIDTTVTLGAQWVGWVGEDAELARLDWIQLPGVRLAQSALEVEVTGPQGTFAELRVEEGVFHSGALEAGEAVVGWSPADALGIWVGRADVPVTLDRIREPEDDALTIRPVISRAVLPLHAGGLGVDLAWVERAQLHGGLSYGTSSVDAPYLWVRGDLHPLGPVPGRRDLSVEKAGFSTGGSVLHRQSESLGSLLLLSGDVEFRTGPFLAAAGWVRADQDDARMEGWSGELGAGFAEGTQGRVHTHVRYEAASGLEADEDWRHIGTARVAWQSTDLRFTAYLEGSASREDGSVSDSDVVDLGRGIERANDTLGLGGLLRW